MRLGAITYGIAAVSVGVIQHGALAALIAGAANLRGPGLFALLIRGADPDTSVGWLILLGGSFVQATLAFVRARTIGRSGFSVLWAALPVLQIPAILGLMAPPLSGEKAEGRTRLPISDEHLAIIVSAAGSLFSVLLGAFVFGAYGYALFLVSPALIGFSVGVTANRSRDRGLGRTMGLAVLGMLFGGLALLVVAIEGLICIAMASPIIAIIVLMGAVFGREEAAKGRDPEARVFASVAILPLLFAVEQLAPSATRFTVTERVFVAASPAVAWRSVVDVRTMPEPPAFPLNLGFAHPVSARWDGQGVGARRLSVFSTGTSLERATEWRPGRSLELEVLTQPPAMRELSPYGEVFAPHVRDYFRTVTARWDVTPAPGGSWITVTTSHEMDLAPGPYWRPIATWIVRANARRGLDHIRARAEAALPSDAASRQGPPHGGHPEILPGL